MARDAEAGAEVRFAIRVPPPRGGFGLSMPMLRETWPELVAALAPREIEVLAGPGGAVAHAVTVKHALQREPPKNGRGAVETHRFSITGAGALLAELGAAEGAGLN